MDLITKKLLNKYENDTLASVYLAKYPEGTNPKTSFAEDFFNAITPLTDHPDILWVEREKDQSDYKVDSEGIKKLLKFLNFSPYELKKKFIMISDAHLMSVIVSNKLLKVFEELPSNFCLFLFAPQDQDLLPTVESRAIKILLPINVALQDQNNDAPLPHYTSVTELNNQLKKSDQDYLEEKKFIENSLLQTLKKPTFGTCLEELENLKAYSRSADFNNSKLARLGLFFK